MLGVNLDGFLALAACPFWSKWTDSPFPRYVGISLDLCHGVAPHDPSFRAKALNRSAIARRSEQFNSLALVTNGEIELQQGNSVLKIEASQPHFRTGVPHERHHASA